MTTIPLTPDARLEECGAMSLPPLVVYKVGGSLFSLPDLAERLRQLWQLQPGTSPLLVVGGGAAADADNTARKARHALESRESNFMG